MTRVAFFGTPDVAVPALEAVADADDLTLVAVVTNPDRPRGRRGTPQPPPVKEAAAALDVPVLQPQRPIEIVDDLRDLDLDVCAVVAYGALLPRRVLDASRFGFVNLHFSLLPRWRGAAPVQHAIRTGEGTTGISTFVLDEGMDTGPILDQVTVDIEPEETAGELLDRLADLGSGVLVRSLRGLAGGAEPTPQSADGVTLAPKITTDDVRLDWEEPARSVVDLVRSANPAPGAHTTFRGKRLKVWRAAVADGEGASGTVIDRDADGVVVAAGTGAVRLLQVQPAGKPRMGGDAFANGYQPDAGEALGS